MSTYHYQQRQYDNGEVEISDYLRAPDCAGKDRQNRGRKKSRPGSVKQSLRNLPGRISDKILKGGIACWYRLRSYYYLPDAGQPLSRRALLCKDR